MFADMTTRAKVLSILAGSVAACAGMVVSVAAAWAVLDLPVPAMRGYVLAQLEPLMREQREHRAVLFDIRRGQLDREIFDLERRQPRSDSDEWRLRQLRDELKQLDMKK